MRYLIVFIGILFGGGVKAQVQGGLYRKVVVFPMAVGPEISSSVVEEAWWKTREALTDHQRFLVAERRFMVNREVFQPRGDLKPADVILLSRILDAEALMVSFLEKRTLHIKVYEAERGFLLWQGKIELHPAKPLSEQLVKGAQGLITEFLARVPYQGFQIIDPLLEKAIYEEDGVVLAKVDIGTNDFVQPDDPVEWIAYSGNGVDPLFSARTPITVIAQGEIVRVEGEVAVVSIGRAVDMKQLKENSLVRLPKEHTRLLSFLPSQDKSLGSLYVNPELKKISNLKKSQSSTTTSLAFLGNLIAFLLLAF